MYREPINVVLAFILSEPAIFEHVEDQTIDDYKKLNEKCDLAISKIKVRKNKNKK